MWKLLVLAPFAILHLEETAISLLDLGTLTKRGDRAAYARIQMQAGPRQRTEAVEVDCKGKRARVAQGAWAPLGGDELRLACSGDVRGMQVIPSLDVARAILNSGSVRSAD